MHGLSKYPISTQLPFVKVYGLSPHMEPFLNEARRRILSLAAGKRIGILAPQIMEVGYSKILYAANKLGVDIEGSRSFILFAPDGTCTYNAIRINRGFTYGALIDAEFNGLMAVNNSMPNGCGYSMYELEDPLPDPQLITYLQNRQKCIGKDSLNQLATGNHFAGVYYVLDPITGEDTNRRFVVVHCSGHVDGDKLYHPGRWLEGTDGYHKIETPHGPIELLEGQARMEYQCQFTTTNYHNARNRDTTMSEIFPDYNWRKLEEITHQGLSENGNQHHIGIQVHDGLFPIAFNPEEGLVAAKTIDNLNDDFIDFWNADGHIQGLGIKSKLRNANIAPHGAGYEFKKGVESMKIHLDKSGISSFDIRFYGDTQLYNFAYFKEIREHMTYRRRNAIMKELYRANLAEVVFEMPSLMQVYPLKSIPGGTHVKGISIETKRGI